MAGTDSSDDNTIFGAVTGDRIIVRSSAIGVAVGQRSTIADREVVFTCRVTGKFSQIAGTLRRKVVELDPPLLNGVTEAWLNDSPLADTDTGDAPPPRT